MGARVHAQHVVSRVGPLAVLLAVLGSACGAATVSDPGGGCVAATCRTAFDCGDLDDGCGGTLHCGDTCAGGETCGGGGTPNVCGCTPTTCATAGANCGTIPDGCGGTLTCGECGAPDTCGGGGVANVCGHSTCAHDV